jgi:FlaA1/EpsC-like NDP-sugar epimerase
MVRINNRYVSNYRIIFILVDTALLLAAVALGYYLRFLIEPFYVNLSHILARSVFFVGAFQVAMYYFELYDVKIIRNSSMLISRLAQSVAAALILFGIAYYIFPMLTLGRGVMVLTILLSTVVALVWRIAYRSLIKRNHLNERIIIVGTGEFAKEIARHIREQRDSGFEIIGHIDEKKGGVKHGSYAA